MMKYLELFKEIGLILLGLIFVISFMWIVYEIYLFAKISKYKDRIEKKMDKFFILEKKEEKIKKNKTENIKKLYKYRSQLYDNNFNNIYASLYYEVIFTRLFESIDENEDSLISVNDLENIKVGIQSYITNNAIYLEIIDQIIINVEQEEICVKEIIEVYDQIKKEIEKIKKLNTRTYLTNTISKLKTYQGVILIIIISVLFTVIKENFF
ncbi:MAG: hypothetical protein MJB14_01035 [Spirochaetes bacterium]|nr:hypothetical protein [Spirochaetota bacterium]